MQWQEALAALRGVRSILVISGAGISVRSGIPTYRGEGGIYDDPVTGRAAMAALSARGFARDPAQTWALLWRKAELVARAEPNAAHHAVAEMEQHFERVVVLTQNIDRLHQRAGSTQVIDLHGDALQTICLDCGERREIDVARGLPEDGIPRCQACGGELRSGVVLFDERLPEDRVARYVDEVQLDLPEAVMAVGTTALFPYIVEPMVDAAAMGRPTIDVNPADEPCHPSIRWHLKGPSELILPALVKAL